MRQMEPHVKWHFSGRKSYFRFLMFQNGSKDQYLGFQRISRKSVKVELLTYHVTRPIIELKLANFKTCSDSFNMGRFCSVLMPVVTPKFQDDWLSKSRLHMKLQNQKLAKNGEFDK